MALTLNDGLNILSGETSSDFYNNDPSNPASAFYIPPTGTYQNNSGQVVSSSTPSTSFSTPSVSTPSAGTSLASGTSMIDSALQFLTSGAPQGSSSTPGASSTSNATSKIFGVTIENIIFVVIGLILIGAGLFSFKSTQNIIDVGSRVAKHAAEIAAS